MQNKVQIVVWDKSRGTGGRMSTSRNPDGTSSLADLGAQYISATHVLRSKHITLMDTETSGRLRRRPWDVMDTKNYVSSSAACLIATALLKECLSNQLQSVDYYGMVVDCLRSSHSAAFPNGGLMKRGVAHSIHNITFMSSWAREELCKVDVLAVGPEGALEAVSYSSRDSPWLWSFSPAARHRPRPCGRAWYVPGTLHAATSRGRRKRQWSSRRSQDARVHDPPGRAPAVCGGDGFTHSTWTAAWRSRPQVLGALKEGLRPMEAPR
ncbi:unnamed protein product [Boreogadus saida]